MEYTVLTEQTQKEIDEICTPTDTISNERLKTSITYFAYHLLGIKAYRHQYLYFREIEKGNKRIITCTSRQIGKSTAVAVISLWACIFNKYPGGLLNNTKICIVSRSDEQAKKLINEIRSLVIKGDYVCDVLTNGKVKDFISRNIDEDSKNTTAQITFKNKCTIKSFPPTDAIRGETADMVFVDEAKDIEADIFNQCIKPTVSKTDGYIMITSTPGGQKGLFFEIFDPFDRWDTHEFIRFWFSWRVIEDANHMLMVETELKVSQESGSIKEFDQEYNALFVVDKTAFFESKKVDDGIDASLADVYEWHKSRVCVGLDYGHVSCRTVLTGTTKYEEKVIRLFQIVYPQDFDESKLVDENYEWSVPAVKKRFDLWKVVVDDCVQGHRTNQDLENKGYEVSRFNFRSDQADRNKGFISFRAMLNKGIIKYPRDDAFLSEMKMLQEEQMKVNVSIHAPKGYHDDRVDSFVMSTIPFLELGSSFKSSTVGGNRVLPSILNNVRNTVVDYEWLNLQKLQKAQEKMYKRKGLIT